MGRPPGAKNKPKPPPPKERAPRERKAAPLYEPSSDSERAKILISTGADIAVMAELMGISVLEFRRIYRKELSSGHDYVYAVITEKLVRSAFGGDMRAQMAWLRQFGGWLETSRKEITGKDGAPISIQSLDGPSLLKIIQTLGEKGSSRRGSGRASAPQIDYDGDSPIVDAVSGSPDESTEE